MGLEDLPILSRVPELSDRPAIVELAEIWDKEAGGGSYPYYVIGIVKNHHPWWDKSRTCDVIVCQNAGIAWEATPGELISVLAGLHISDLPRHGYCTLEKFKPGQYVFRKDTEGEIVSY